MAITLVQQNAGTFTDDGTLAFLSDVAAGSLLVAVFAIDNETTEVLGITDTRGNTWTRRRRQANAGRANSSEIWSAPNPNAGANTITVDFSAALGCQALVAEFSGFTNGVTNGPDNGAEADNSTSHSCGSINTTVNDSLSVASYRIDTNFSVTARGDSFNALTGGTRRDSGYKIHTTTETVDADITTAAGEFSSGVIANWFETTPKSLIFKDQSPMAHLLVR